MDRAVMRKKSKLADLGAVWSGALAQGPADVVGEVEW